MAKILDFNETAIANEEVVMVLKQIDVHAVQTNEKLDELSDKVEDLNKAFPAGDLDGHCRYHQVMIDDIASRKDLTKAIKEKGIVSLFIMLAGFVCLAVWHEFLRILPK